MCQRTGTDRESRRLYSTKMGPNKSETLYVRRSNKKGCQGPLYLENTGQASRQARPCLVLWALAPTLIDRTICANVRVITAKAPVLGMLGDDNRMYVDV